MPVPAATSATDSLTANPNGTFTFVRSALPVRNRVNGTWKDLDATLVRQADGTIRPANSMSGLSFSGGGSAPLAALTDAGRSLAVVAPMTLPAPTLSGSTATYPNVLSGVDLQVRADTQGGFTQVFVIRDAAAAANPELRKITMGVQTQGVNVVADADQNLAAVDAHGNAVFTAPAPRMWDSAETGSPASSLRAVPAVDRAAEHQAPVGVAVAGSSIALTPDQGLLSAPSTVYPVYVDPGWSNTSSKKSAWSTIAADFPTTKYYNSTPDPHGQMQVGNSGEIKSRTLINMPLPASTLSGATIQSAEFNVLENWSYSCTTSQVNLYAPSTTLTSGNAYWNAWDGKLGSAVADANVAHGYNSSCPSKAVGFDVTSTIAADAKANRATRTFALAAASETDNNGWKEFDPTSPSLSINYNHAPNQPTGLTTSPSTACTAATPTVVGDGDVKLYAPVSDRDGGALSVAYVLYANPNFTTPLAGPTAITMPSGSTAVYVLHKADLEKWASGVTTFTWKVRVSDSIALSSYSVSCQFRFDETRPGAPTVDTPEDGTTTIGQPVSLTVTPPSGEAAPGGYLYQLNGAIPQSAPTESGSAMITVTPTRYTNILNVTSTSAAGNIGDSATVIFNSAAPDRDTDQDLTGDGIPDLLAAGTGLGFAPGLWMGQGQAGAGHLTGTGRVVKSAVNIGAYGSTVGGTGPASFNGSQAISGPFTLSGLQDVFAYYPTGTNAGIAAIISGNGDGSVLQSQFANNVIAIPSGTFSDGNGDNPQQLVSGGDTLHRGQNLPDLIGISGDATFGYSLNYYPNDGAVGGYAEVDQLTTTFTPTGGTDWNTWTLASAQTAGGTQLFLWQRGTGALYLWTNMAYTQYDTSISHDQVSLGTWNQKSTASIQAADVDGNGNADLWTVGLAGSVTTWLNNGNTTLTSTTPQRTTSPNHSWMLNDGDNTGVGDNPITTAADTTSTAPNPLTGNAGVAWNTGGLFDPDAKFNGTSGALASSTSAVESVADFTISVWVKAKAPGGYVLSQDGPTQSNFVLYPGTNNLWTFGMVQTFGPTFGYDTVSDPEGPVQYGMWQHVSVTFNMATRTMALYVDGNPVQTFQRDSNARPTAGAFQVGDRQVNGTHSGYFNGEIANVQTWNTTLSPDQIAEISGTPDHILFPADDTTYASGTSWKSPCSTMTFSQGLLSIKETCHGTDTVTFGAGGYPNAGLVMQADGNLTIYKDATARTPANVLFASNTSGNPGDSMFLQPDGNLVIYAATGAAIFAAGTYNRL